MTILGLRSTCGKWVIKTYNIWLNDFVLKQCQKIITFSQIYWKNYSVNLLPFTILTGQRVVITCGREFHQCIFLPLVVLNHSYTTGQFFGWELATASLDCQSDATYPIRGAWKVATKSCREKNTSAVAICWISNDCLSAELWLICDKRSVSIFKEICHPEQNVM